MSDLSELVSDITSPTVKDKVLAYVENLQMEDDDFMEILLSKMDNMVITWEQPWYQEFKTLTRPITQTGETEEPFRTDRFTSVEMKQLKKNWKKFRKHLGVPDKPICLARWKNPKCRNPNSPLERVRHYVISFLAQGLERTLFQVNYQFIAYYGAPKQGPFTDIEDKLIKICAYHVPKKAVRYSALILGRQERGIRKRLTAMGNDILSTPEKPEKIKKIKWTITKASQLLKSLLKHSGKKLKRLKCEKFDTSVWVKVQEDMGVDYTIIKQFWYKFLHVQLFAKYDISLRRLRKKIFKCLQSSPYEMWTDITWNRLLQDFPSGFTRQFLHHVVYSLVKTYPYPTKAITAPLPELLDYGLKQLHSLKKIRRNKKLKSLAVNENGDLELVHYSRKFP